MVGLSFVGDIERRTNDGAYIRHQAFKNIDVPGYRWPAYGLIKKNGRDKLGHQSILIRSSCYYVEIGVGMVRNALVACQNSCRLVASTTECATPGRMINWRSPLGS